MGQGALLLCGEHAMPDVTVISYRLFYRIAKFVGTALQDMGKWSLYLA